MNMSTRMLRLGGLALAAAAAAGLGGCVSGNTHEMLRTAHAKLLEEQKDLLAENAHLKGMLSNSAADRKAAEDARNRLSQAEAERARLEADRARLDAERQRMESDLARLRDELARAQAQAADATGRNSATNDQIERYRRQIGDLESRLRDMPTLQAPPPPPVIVQQGPLVDKPEVNEAVKRIAREHGLTYDERTGMLMFPADLLFPSGQDSLLAGADVPLRKLAAVIDHPQVRDFRIRIVGHTDKRPIVHEATKQRFPTNWHLSCARSISVMAELMKGLERGKDAAGMERLKDRFEAVGRGQREPIAQGDTEAAYRRNRRVEVFFVPPGQVARSVAAAGSVGN
jgi:chemotaxis protein MotB